MIFRTTATGKRVRRNIAIFLWKRVKSFKKAWDAYKESTKASTRCS